MVMMTAKYSRPTGRCRRKNRRVLAAHGERGGAARSGHGSREGGRRNGRRSEEGRGGRHFGPPAPLRFILWYAGVQAVAVVERINGGGGGGGWRLVSAVRVRHPTESGLHAIESGVARHLRGTRFSCQSFR